MSALSAKLRSLQGDQLQFWCPGCNTTHVVSVGGGESWQWNGDAERPTFTPSVLVRSGHHSGRYNGQGCWCSYNADKIARGEEPSGFKCEVCHSFITDGRIQFLGDCTHALAGQTVELPDWTEAGT